MRDLVGLEASGSTAAYQLYGLRCDLHHAIPIRFPCTSLCSIARKDAIVAVSADHDAGILLATILMQLPWDA